MITGIINFRQSFSIVRNAPSYIFPLCYPFCLVILSYHFLSLNSSIAVFAGITCSVPVTVYTVSCTCCTASGQFSDGAGIQPLAERRLFNRLDAVTVSTRPGAQNLEGQVNRNRQKQRKSRNMRTIRIESKSNVNSVSKSVVTDWG